MKVRGTNTSSVWNLAIHVILLLFVTSKTLSPWFVFTIGTRGKDISLFNLSPFPLWDELLHPTTEQCEPGAMSVRSFAIATSSFAIAILPIWRLTHDTMRDDAHRT
jgi:hypothetical protein